MDLSEQSLEQDMQQEYNSWQKTRRDLLKFKIELETKRYRMRIADDERELAAMERAAKT